MSLISLVYIFQFFNYFWMLTLILSWKKTGFSSNKFSIFFNYLVSVYFIISFGSKIHLRFLFFKPLSLTIRLILIISFLRLLKDFSIRSKVFFNLLVYEICCIPFISREIQSNINECKKCNLKIINKVIQFVFILEWRNLITYKEAIYLINKEQYSDYYIKLQELLNVCLSYQALLFYYHIQFIYLWVLFAYFSLFFY